MTLNDSFDPVLPRLRIAHVAPQLDIGGMERLLVEFGRHADSARFELHFISLTDRGDIAAGIEACGWPVTALSMRPGLQPSCVWKLLNYFRRAKIDLVHTHNNKSLIYAAPAARLAGIRRIIHTRHGQNFSCKPREIWLMRTMSRLSSQLVAVSKDSADLAIQSGFPRSKVMHILNGIDLEAFPYSQPVQAGPILMAGRLSPEKNVAKLIDAAAILHSQGKNLHWEIAGDGPCKQSLERLAEENGLRDRVKFLGQVDSMQAVFKRASMLVLPSLTEGVSLALLEAMACGLPVVATAVGGNPEVVQDGVTGILIPPNDAAALAKAVWEVKSKPSEFRRMSFAARARVDKHFNVTRMVSEYERLYTDALPSQAISSSSCFDENGVNSRPEQRSDRAEATNPALQDGRRRA